MGRMPRRPAIFTAARALGRGASSAVRTARRWARTALAPRLHAAHARLRATRAGRLLARPLVALTLTLALAAFVHGTSTPTLARARALAPPVALLGAALLVVSSSRPRHRLAALVPLAVFATDAGVAARNRARVEHAPPEQLARLGAHVVVGYLDVETAEALLRRGAIGGVFVTTRNVQGKPRRALQAELARLRAAARPDAPPLVIAADHEGGPVSRLAPHATALPPLSRLVGPGGEIDGAAVDAYGALHAKELAALGLDVNLAPVADLRLRDAHALLDLHTQLDTRAIDEDPRVVAEVTARYAHALAAGGVSPTLKHFPGLGRVAADTHLFDGVLDVPVAELEANDWRPFAAPLPASALVMVGHVRVPALDPAQVASTSPAIVDGALRGRLGFRGVVITDDLAMKPTAAAPGGMGGSAVRALQAGVDLVLIAYDPRQYDAVMAALLDADDAGALDPARLAASRARLFARRAPTTSPAPGAPPALEAARARGGLARAEGRR
jgi:beta-N-acetylhexosaminidase